MNQINKLPISSLGYDFVAPEYTPQGKDEYYLRHKQNRSGIIYRSLTTKEIKTLIANNNVSDNWKKVEVAEPFNPSLISNCKFYGWVRIGKLEAVFLEFHDVRLPVGLYNSSIISCDLGDNVVISNVNYLSHYIIGNEVIITNVNEVEVSDHSKFGNGILKRGEKEAVRIWLELCNENAGRSILPFNGMLPGDAMLWTRYRDDEVLMEKFKVFTEKRFDKQRGYYGKIGDRTVIKNTRIIKDAWIGTDVYIKGANKLKNLTINSSAESPTQIGEGCELVNGIVGYGCRIFYGVKAVRFVLASHSQLKYGARLINSFLGDNSTISCCEVLNSLIFPAHEQHHNNSFLCAALVMGQSNMAAGATIGSNHNSRGADGELIAGRGFWPGLCVSLKHNSRFASFTLMAKGDFPAELNITIPFSLISNDVSKDKLVIMPGYWFMYNMYALARNAGKYSSRDQRIDKTQLLEYDFLAPDSINELFDGIEVLKKAVGKSQKKNSTDEQAIKLGEKLLEQRTDLRNTEILAEGMENSNRKVQLVKVTEAYHLFIDLIIYHGISQLIPFIEREKINDFDQLVKKIGKTVRSEWTNIGGQLIPKPVVSTLVRNIHHGKVNSWDEVHSFYIECGNQYKTQKLQHSFASLLEILKLNPASFNKKIFANLLEQAVTTKEWIVKGIYDSRAKDYSNEFRKMVYNSQKEMETVIGKLKDNSFILHQEQELKSFKKKVALVQKTFKI
jgi:NDP-sugar pyrophosphorylase family protein